MNEYSLSYITIIYYIFYPEVIGIDDYLQWLRETKIFNAINRENNVFNVLYQGADSQRT